MIGIRIYGQPVFAELFEPVFDRLQGLLWITLTDAFMFPAAWVDASEFDEVTGCCTSGPCADFERDVRRITGETGATQYGYISNVDIFPQYAAAVLEDWNTIFGFRQPIHDARAWIDRYFASTQRAAIAAEADVCFINVDSAFWEFHTRDQTIIGELQAHLANLNVTFDECSIADSPGL